jgi:hypothetical protein
MKGLLKSKRVLTLFRSDNNKKKRSFTMKLIRIACCLLVLLLSLVASAFVTAHPVAAQGLNPPRPSGATCEGGPHQVLHNQLQELCAALT